MLEFGISQEVSLKCVCETNLKWLNDCAQTKALRRIERHCQCCGKTWNIEEEDGNCVLWCPLGITEIHPNGFFVCETCSTKVCNVFKRWSLLLLIARVDN